MVLRDSLCGSLDTIFNKEEVLVGTLVDNYLLIITPGDPDVTRARRINWSRRPLGLITRWLSVADCLCSLVAFRRRDYLLLAIIFCRTCF